MGFERRSFDCFSFGKAYIISGENVSFTYERQVGLHPFHRIRLAKAEQVGVTGRIQDSSSVACGIHLHSFMRAFTGGTGAVHVHAIIRNFKDLLLV